VSVPGAIATGSRRAVIRNRPTTVMHLKTALDPVAIAPGTDTFVR
jgi:hypothetical protein